MVCTNHTIQYIIYILSSGRLLLKVGEVGKTVGGAVEVDGVVEVIEVIEVEGVEGVEGAVEAKGTVKAVKAVDLLVWSMV